MENVMRFALVSNSRVEASPKLTGRCEACGDQLFAKCGTKKIWHWSHRGKLNCDPWWESETEWHRAWKNLFPCDWQEILHRAPNDERHIADIKTPPGLVIEVQHSAIAEAEMNAREACYTNMIWIVDATRLKRDRARFAEGIQTLLRPIVPGYYLTRRAEDCFPSAWLNRKVPVLFDHEALAGFNNGAAAEKSRLWCLLPGRVDGYAIVVYVSRRKFAEIARQRSQIFPSEQLLKTIQVLLTPRRKTVPLFPVNSHRYSRKVSSRTRRYPRF
jgi:hypothetical protein